MTGNFFGAPASTLIIVTHHLSPLISQHCTSFLQVAPNLEPATYTSIVTWTPHLYKFLHMVVFSRTNRFFMTLLTAAAIVRPYKALVSPKSTPRRHAGLCRFFMSSVEQTFEDTDEALLDPAALFDGTIPHPKSLSPSAVMEFKNW